MTGPKVVPSEIAADDFAALVKLLQRGPAVPVTVIGKVSFAAWKCDRNIVFEGIEFTGDFLAQNAELRGVTFESCTFASYFDCSNSVIAGDLVLNNCQFLDLPGRDLEPRMRLDCVEIGGNAHLSVDGNLSARNAVVGGDMMLAPSRYRTESGIPILQLDHAQVRGAIEINTVRSRPRAFSEAKRLKVEQLLSLSGASCAKLEIEAVDVMARLDISGLKSSGSMTLNGVVAGQIDGFGCRAGGDLSILASPTAHEAEPGSIMLGSAQVSGRIRIGGYDRPLAFPGDASRLSLSGNLGVQGSKCANLVIIEVDVAELIDFSALEAAYVVLRGITARQVRGHSCTLGTIELGDMAVGPPQVRIEDQFTLWSTTIREQLEIRSAAFIRKLRLGDCRIGSLWLGSEATYFGPTPPEDAQPSLTLGGLEVFDTRFESFVRMTRTRVLYEETGDGETNGSMEFKNCHFASEFGTWGHRRYAHAPDGEPQMYIDGWETDNHVEIERDFVMTDCNADRFVDLTRLKAGVAGSEVGGAIRLDGTTIGDELRFRSPISTAARRDLPPEAIEAAVAEWTRVRNDGTRNRSTKAHAARLSMIDLRAGSIDLSGLTLHGRPDRASGSIDGSRVAVRGSLSLYAKASEANLGPDVETADGARFAYAVVPGAVRLDGAQLGELRAIALTFRERDKPIAERQAHSDGLVLEAADIRLLRVPRLTSLCDAEGPGCDAFPAPLDLAGLSVRHWFFTNEESGDPCKEADEYLDFLDNDEGLHRDVYHAVSETLRNLGADEHAEQVLFTSHYRANAPSHWPAQRGSGRLRPWLGMGSVNMPRRASPTATAALRGLRQLIWPITAVLYWLGQVLRSFFMWLDRMFLRYRRNPISLLGIAILLYMLSLPVAIDPRNFELSLNGRASAMLECVVGVGGRDTDFIAAETGSMPSPAAWSAGDAAWMALRYHLPVIALTARSDFEASDNEPLHYGFSRYSPDSKRLHGMTKGRCAGDAGMSRLAAVPRQSLIKEPAASPLPEPAKSKPAASRAGGVTAEDWFSVMAILNWILWPLLLTFLLRTLLRAQ